MNKLRLFLPFIFTALLFSVITFHCADDPTSLGLKFIPPGETLGVKIFDSYTDTMVITSRNVKKYVNTSSSANLIVGQSGSYNSKGLIKFTGLNNNFDSATVVSAILKLRYRNYYFPASPSDSLGQISFDIFKVQNNINYSSITLDSIGTNPFGNTSQGNFTGIPTADSQEVDIPLNTQLIKDWLEYAADTGYAVKNYGIVLSPNASSTVLKSFYSKNGGGLVPVLYFIVTKNSHTDTVSHSSSETVFLADASLTPIAGSFYLQAGISYVQVMTFDMHRIPSTATINDAKIYLTLDPANSIFTLQTSKVINGDYITDTAGLKTDYTFQGSPSGSQYVITFSNPAAPNPFQRWLQGQTNYGLLIRANNNNQNLDRFSFFDINAADPNTKPRVIIKYTPRP